MVTNTKYWETTHGFADCINAHAHPQEYKIIHAIVSSQGKANHHTLVAALETEKRFADLWIERCRKKKLITKQGEEYRIHLQNPLLKPVPSTKIAAPLITKREKSRGNHLTRLYSPSQIKQAAQAAFGPDFAIRSMRNVSLPVYSMQIKNSDGSLHTTFWNALTGKQIHHHSSLIE
jgi:hypothetical protein